MLDLVNIFLPMLLYICGIILLIVLIILGINLIGTIKKFDQLIDNVENKVNSLNTVFSLIDRTTDGIIGIGNTIVKSVSSMASKIMNRRKSYTEESDIDE